MNARAPDGTGGPGMLQETSAATGVRTTRRS